MKLLHPVIVILALALSASSSFLDVIPSNGITEGDVVLIQCSEVFPYGVQSNSKMILRQNSSDYTQSAIWKLSRNRLSYTPFWSLPRTLTKSVSFNSVYTLKYKFVASFKHNRMEIQCLSSRTSLSRTPRKIIFVRKLPEVLNCITNPSQVISKRPIVLRCWIVLGSPRASNIYVKSNDTGIRVGRARHEYQTETKFSYRISLMSWLVIPARYDDDLSFRLTLKNGIGITSKDFNLKAKHKRKIVKNKTVVKDPTARLVITPGKLPGQNLHENDIIKCRVVNGTADWKVRLVAKFAKSNITENIFFQTNSVEYVVPKTAVGNFMSYKCIATSQGISPMTEEDIAKWVFPANHRSFLNLYSQLTVFPQDSTVRATCVFLPGIGGYPKMILSILSSNDQEVKMKAVYDGDVKHFVSQNKTRYPVPKCGGVPNLFTCHLQIVSIKADDLGTKFRCETETNNRKDTLERRINMTVAPDIGMLTPTPMLLANENETVTATCLVRLGYPSASDYSLDFDSGTEDDVQKKNDPEIKDMNGLKWIVLRTVKKMTVQDQGGTLACKASNVVKTVIARSLVLVRMPVYNVTITPSYNDTLKRNQRFACRAYGYPLPEITMTGSLRDRQFVATHAMLGFLYFRSASHTALIYPGDEIVITCTAKNTLDGKVYKVSKVVKYRSGMRLL